MQVANLNVKILKLVHVAVLKDKDKQVCLNKIRDVIADVPELNVRERARCFVAAKKIAEMMYIQNGNPTNSQIKKFCTSMNKVNEHQRTRLRKQKLKEQLRTSRANQGVFFLCSTHSNPAEDHKDYQGLIYVDRYWKNTLKNDLATQKKVAAYIRNHDTVTVQHICGAPVYMITRPYCKHFFIPLGTDEVLGGSVKKIRQNHPEGTVHEHNINYRKKFYKLRYRIHKELGMLGEAKMDLKVIARNS